MNLIGKLFSKTPSISDIRLQLKEIERGQKSMRRDLEVLERNKQDKVRQAVEAKKAGRQEVVRDIFREMRQIEIDNGYANNDLRRLSLAKTALTSFLRRMELLDRKKDRKSMQNLIMRFKKSSIQKAIDTADVDDDAFNGLLEEILGEEELSATRGQVKEDSGFADFDRAIEEMAKAEGAAAGDEDLSKAYDTAGKTRIKGPDNYPSYGDKPQSIRGLEHEPLSPVFPGVKEPEGAPPKDPCADSCVGGSANYTKMHG